MSTKIIPTIAQSLQDAARSLSTDSQSAFDSARLDVELLLAFVLGKDRSYVYAWPERKLTGEQLKAFQALVYRRLQGEPIAYILQEKEFWSLPLLVDSSTLIPRPDTELLVELALSRFEASDPIDTASLRVADLGTGTGAVALALACEKPEWQVLGLEKSPAALALAHKNRQRLGFDNVDFILSDWFSALSREQRFHIIVSNPPYIDKDDYHLIQGDVRFEPETALVSGKGGLADLESIIWRAFSHLEEAGWLLLEHGYQQAEAVRALLAEHRLQRIETHRDLSGQPRVTMGQR